MNAVDILMVGALVVIAWLMKLCVSAQDDARSARARDDNRMAEAFDDIAKLYGFAMFIVIGVFILIATISSPTFYGPA